MKILHVLYSGLGGHGNIFFSLISADTNNQFTYEAIFNGIEEVKEEYIKKCDALGIQWTFIKKRPGLDTDYLKGLVKAIKKSNADIIFLHSSSYILPCRLGVLTGRKKKKIIVRETQANNLKNKKEWRWLSVSFLLADHIVFLSEEFRKEVENNIPAWYKKRKAVVIPNGIDLSLFHPGIKHEKPAVLIGMQSRLTDNKDHPTLLLAFELLKNKNPNGIKLQIAGDGKCMQHLIQLAQELKIENDVDFKGMLNEKELATFLRDLDIYIHASYGETMSTALMQAMASRLPVIASDVPGINNMIINNETGILVPVKNEKILSEAIQKLLNDPSFAKKLSENAYNYANSNYSNIIMFKKYKELFTL